MKNCAQLFFLPKIVNVFNSLYADVKLYDFFNKTFWNRVQDFGYERMESMKYEFGLMQKKAEKECIDSYVPFKKKPWILGAKLKRNPSDKCKHLAWSETVYKTFFQS